MQRILRRGIVVAALLTTITPALGRAGASGAPAAPAPADPVAGSTGADWLAGQLTDGLVHNDQYAFDDYGLTIDVALGLAAAGGQDARVADGRRCGRRPRRELHHRRRLRLRPTCTPAPPPRPCTWPTSPVRTRPRSAAPTWSPGSRG